MSGDVVDSQKEKNKTVKNVWIVRLCQTFHCWSAHVMCNEGPVRAILAGPLLLDGALDVPPFVKNILHDATVSNLEVVGGGATLLEGDLGLFVPAVDDELVMVHKSLEGVWQMWVTVYVEGKLVHDLLCYLFNTIFFQAVL